MSIFEKKEKSSKININKNNNGYNNQDNEVLLNVLEKLCEIQVENKKLLKKLTPENTKNDKKLKDPPLHFMKKDLVPSKSNNYTFKNIKNLRELRNLCKYLAQETMLEFNNKNIIVEKGLICLYSSLIGYVFFACFTTDHELNSIIELLNLMDFKRYSDNENPVDLIFEQLEETDPEHYALRQYIMFSHLPYDLKSELVFMANYYLNSFLAETGYKKYHNTKQKKAQIIDFTKLAKKHQKICNICGADLIERKSKKTGKVYLICSNFKNCGKNKK